MDRRIEPFVKKDLSSKLVLLTGPRQVGKTTLSKALLSPTSYLNFDSVKDRKTIVSQTWDRTAGLVVFDELHKMRKWKAWIKGVYDTETRPPALLVTGSARLDIYRKGGDSLAGRHFVHRLHPVTIKEAEKALGTPEAWRRLVTVGGFPEPFLNGDAAYAQRWRRQHLDVVLRQDLMDLNPVRDIKSIETMVEMLRERVGSPVSYASLARDLQTTIATVRHWLELLENLYVIFSVRPYHRNVARSLLKEPKYYFYDTGAVEGGVGPRVENAVAVALKSELQFHEDTTGDAVDLCYLRDKEKREVDFLTVSGKKPRHLIEVKADDDSFSPALFHFARFFPGAAVRQLVGGSASRKTKGDALLQPAQEFLTGVSF